MSRCRSAGSSSSSGRSRPRARRGGRPHRDRPALRGVGRTSRRRRRGGGMQAVERRRRASCPERRGTRSRRSATAACSARKSDLFHRYESYGEPDAEVEMAYYFWLLRRGAETILVDTGFDPAVGDRRGRTCVCPPLRGARAARYRSGGRLDARRDPSPLRPRREPRGLPRRRSWWFRERSWSSGQDRCGSLPVRVPRRAGRDRAGRRGTPLGPRQARRRYRADPGGITAIVVGGHSPGQQVTVVAGAAGDVVLTSDAVHFYEELEARPTVRGGGGSRARCTAPTTS